MSVTVPRSAERRVAMILSGGGARGAYEVGVLSWIFDDLTKLRGEPPRIDILCGTSVGAINACYLTAHLADPVLGVRRLVDLWSELQISKVLGFGPRQLAGLPRLLAGGSPEGAGLFDVRPMADLVQREISWRALSRAIRRRYLRALTVSATEVSTGRTTVFMQTSPDTVVPKDAPPRTHFQADPIGPHHALASAAIPMIFPPVRIHDQLYLDGGLRQNTPIAPALRLGATHIFAIGLSRDVRGPLSREGTTHAMPAAPGAAFLLGKVLNAFLLDHIDVDIDLLERLNRVIEDGTGAFGPDFTERMSARAHLRGAPAYRPVTALMVRPSDDIGRLASAHVRRGKLMGNPMVTRRLLSLLDLGAGDEADLASYLLFDGNFARQLIEMGRADARARRDEIVAFFEEPRGSQSLLPADVEETGVWSHLPNPLGT